MKLQRGNVVEVTIESLAFGGEGVAKVPVNEGLFTLFLEDVVPGDIVKARVGKVKKNYGYAYVDEILVPSKLRSTPRCSHFGSKIIENELGRFPQGCGGCSFQNLRYEDQLAMKQQQVVDALVRIGGLSKNVVQSIVGCGEPWFYRNKMEFSFGTSKSGELSLGLHAKRRHYDTIELQECYLMAPYIGDFIRELRDFFRTQLGPAQENSTEHPLTSLVIREGKRTGEVLVNLVAENQRPQFLSEFLVLVQEFFQKADFLQKYPQKKLVSVFFTQIHNQKGQRKRIEEELLFGKATFLDGMRVNEHKTLQFEISPQAFFQPNTFQAELLYQKALEASEIQSDEVVFDLFCGAGTIGIFCSVQAKMVYGIELNESAILNARRNADINGITNIDFLVGDVGKKLPELKEKLEGKVDVVIVDPPRNGLAPEVIEQIIAFGPEKVTYVSCNPTSLARDLKLFTQQNYQTLKVTPVDMFPQTYHIECVAQLRKKKADE